MTEEQARFILFKASAAYPNQIELTGEIVTLWAERLAKIPFNRGVDNLNEHLDSQKFFPTISEIIRLDKIDPEAEARNIEIAFCKYVNAGGDPDTYVYEPADGLGGNTPKLRS